MASRPSIEARSLSDINFLADHPPQYPHNPTEELRDPLTLYISRVPGTRDVILSTLKPQRKNVTAEDIANALYYVHLDLPSDSLLATPAPTQNRGTSSPRTSGELARPIAPIPRKPVPGAAKLVKDQRPPLHPLETHEALQERPGSQQAPAEQHTSPLVQAPQTPQAAQQTTPPPQQESPPPQLPSPPKVPVPWVPPGFHLDQSHALAPAAQDEAPPTPDATPPLPMRPLPGAQAGIARKPLGPRSLSPQDKELPTSPLHDRAHVLRPSSPLKHAAGVDDDEIPPPKLPPRPDPLARQPAHPQAPISPTRPTGLQNLDPFQLTLIRRDPANSYQWNVGKIASAPPPEDDGLVETGPQSMPEPPGIRIRLETSGYAKFRGFPSRQSIENATSRDTSNSSLPHALANAKDVDAAGGFSRSVVMAYTKSWTAGIRGAFKRHDRSASDIGPGAVDASSAAHAPETDASQAPPWPARDRHDSVASIESDGAGGGVAGVTGVTGGATGGIPPNLAAALAKSSPPPQPADAIITRPGPGLKPRGYVFTSPWDGRCEFRTGNGGRSLKLRHQLHANNSSIAGYNPLVLAQNIRDGQGMAAATGGGRSRAASLTSAITGAVTVSELRFNLPNAELFRPKPEPAAVRHDLYGRFQDQWQLAQQQYQQRYLRTSDDEYDDDDDDDDLSDSALDLSLGRERAGGGNRGKRAKLGKLIIYDDGFKMLDLIVAANMGIWWVSWERSF